MLLVRTVATISIPPTSDEVRSETAPAIGTALPFFSRRLQSVRRGVKSTFQLYSKRYRPIIRQVFSLRVLCDRDFCFFRIRLAGEFRSLRIPALNKNQACVFQFLQ